MASKATNKGLPEGFQSPFARVQMEERMDDSLACVATLTGRSLADVNKLAVELSVPAYGPYFIDGDMIAKLLMKLGNLVATVYMDFISYDALPDVAILLVDYDEKTEIGRHVVWHHVRGTKDRAALSYIVDPGQWIDPTDQITTVTAAYEPAYYIEISARPNGKGK